MKQNPDDPAVKALQQRLNTLAWWLDDCLPVPFTQRRIGLDGLVGLLPGVGDAATTLVSAYLVLEARRLGIPKRQLTQMLWNLAVDGVVGSVPLVGDLFDFGWKANRRNIRLLNEHLEKAGRTIDMESEVQL